MGQDEVLFEMMTFEADHTGSQMRGGTILLPLGNQTMLVQHAQYDPVH